MEFDIDLSVYILLCHPEILMAGNNSLIFYITCIDESQKLEPFYEKYQNDFHCVYQEDIYSREQWLEIMPKKTSKSNAIKQLQALMKCERLVVFGDGRNDIDMFQIADEGYDVSNAHEDLKKNASATI